MFRDIRGTRASDHLDMIRGLAAVMVLLFHVRYRFFLDYSDVAAPDLLTRAWYGATAFGHDAVMVFFVVSGFLVGSSVLRSLQANRWQWADYLTARCVRLYVVLIPGLLLTLAWDTLGLQLFGEHAIYTGVRQGYVSDFSNVSARLGWWPFIANAAFLQGVRAPQLGSNEALWSLAFEFWYYIAFPLLALAGVGRLATPWKVAAAAGAAAVFYFTGSTIAWYFPIWLIGVLVGALPSSGWISRRPLAWIAFAGLAFATWLLASHMAAVKHALGDSMLLVDTATGLLFGLLLYSALHDRRAADCGAYGLVGRSLAGISYTLYIVHLPLLVFLRAWLVPDRPWSVSAPTLAAAAGLVGVALAYAYGVAHVTEHHTARVKRVLDGWRGQRQPVETSPVMTGQPIGRVVH